MNFEVHKMYAPNVPGVFDSDIDAVKLCYGWHWPEKYFWWFYAEHPGDYEWRLEGDMLEYKVEGVWTLAEFLGSEEPEWVMARRIKDGIDILMGVRSGRVIERTWNQSDIPIGRSDWGPLRMELGRIKERVGKMKGDGCEAIPDFTSEQLNTLREKLNRRYLEAAEKWAARDPFNAWHTVMEENKVRLSEIGFGVPEHNFVRKKLVVEIFNFLGAVFVTSPDRSHSADSSNCECANCYHSPEDYNDGDNCICDNCIDNGDHWHENGNDPDHCNFCALYAVHRANGEDECEGED